MQQFSTLYQIEKNYHRQEVYFSQTDESNKDKRPFENMIHDTVSCEPILEASAKKDFINTYLKEHDTFKEKPDGITYRQKMPYIEYYTDENDNKISFVIHICKGYLINSESEDTAFKDTVICTTLYKDELIKAGTLTTTYKQNGSIVAKQLNSPNKIELAYYKYEYKDGVPFPFIVEGSYIRFVENMY